MILFLCAFLYVISAVYLHVQLWRLQRHAPAMKYDYLKAVAKDAIAFAEEKAASHQKRVSSASGQAKDLKWSWQDKRDAALSYARKHAPKASTEELILRIEAELGILRIPAGVVTSALADTTNAAKKKETK